MEKEPDTIVIARIPQNDKLHACRPNLAQPYAYCLSLAFVTNLQESPNTRCSIRGNGQCLSYTLNGIHISSAF